MSGEISRSDADAMLSEIREINEALVLSLVQAHREFDAQSAQFQEMLSSIDHAIMVSDARFVLKSWNAAAERAYGWRQDEVLGREQWDVVGAELPAVERATVRQDTSPGSCLRFRQAERHKNGRLLEVEGSIHTLRDAGGNVTGYMTTIHDAVMRRPHASQPPVVWEASPRDVGEPKVERLKAELLSTVTHELRTPLNAIIGFTSLVMDGLEGKEQLAHLKMVLKAATHLLSMIDTILEVSRIMGGISQVERDWFDLNELVSAVVGEVRPDFDLKGLTIAVEMRGPLLVCSDRRKIKRILREALDNALKFTDTGGVTVVCSASGQHVQVAVSDTGVGISRELSDMVIGPFRQGDASIGRHHAGLGLGLYLSKNLLEMLDGTLEFDSQVEHGARLKITIPISPDGVLIPSS